MELADSMDEHSNPHCVGGPVLTSLCIQSSNYQNGDTPLTEACGNGELDTVIELLRAGAKTNIHNYDN